MLTPSPYPICITDTFEITTIIHNLDTAMYTSPPCGSLRGASSSLRSIRSSYSLFRLLVRVFSSLCRWLFWLNCCPRRLDRRLAFSPPSSLPSLCLFHLPLSETLPIHLDNTVTLAATTWDAAPPSRLPLANAVPLLSKSCYIHYSFNATLACQP